MGSFSPPRFSEEQNAIIRAPRAARLVVVAGPGTGKTATACARIDYLIGEGDVSPNRVLFVSFTRTAVAELRQRILAGAVDESAARSVRIATIDSQAWRLRTGFSDDEPKLGLSYDQSLRDAVAMLEQGRPDQTEHLARIDHIVVDEAQDVGDLRARFLVALFRHISPKTGVTIFADPFQAIFGFSEEDAPEGETHPEPLLQRLRFIRPSFEEHELRRVFRTNDPKLLALLRDSRTAIARAETDPHEVVQALRQLVALYGRDTATPALDDLAGQDDALVLYRSRTPVHLASYYLSKELTEHRLRMSGLPTIASPWIGVVLSRVDQAYLGREDFLDRWKNAQPAEMLAGLDPNQAWRILIKVVGENGRLHLPTLARELAKERPHVDLCEAEVGIRGPVLSTIHASKGREANTVRIMLKSYGKHVALEDEEVEEEARVLYVALTRARQRLEVGKGIHRPTEVLPSGRVYSRRKGAAHVQIGCAGDVDPIAHLRWGDADKLQTLLANACLGSMHATASRRADLEHRYVVSVRDGHGERPVAVLTSSINRDLFTLRERCEFDGPPPSRLTHLTVFGCRAIGIPAEQRDGVREPFATSGIALAPVVKGFAIMSGPSGAAKRGKTRRKR